MSHQGKAIFKSKENACKKKMHMTRLHPKEIWDGSKIEKTCWMMMRFNGNLALHQCKE